MGEFSLMDIYFEMEKIYWHERRPIKDVVKNMANNGELERIGHGRYRFIQAKPRISNIKERTYRAIFIKGIFETGDIVRLSDGNPSYCRRIIRRLVKAGDVELLTKKRIPGGGPAKIYRVRHKDVFHNKYIRD
jgi:hypothetical protein